MKYAPLVLVFIAVIAAAAWGIWASHLGSSKATSTLSSTNPAPEVGVKPPSPPPTSSTFLKPNEWQEFRSDRDAILNANRELASEYKALLNEMDGQQKDLESAMIKADPQVAPVITKIESMRKPVSATPVASPSGKTKPTLTQDDLAQLRAARMAALKANPDFNTKAAQTATKLRAFQEKLVAAMVNADPTVAPIVAKFSGGHPIAKVASSPSKPE
jgi:hypothetical protein